MAELILFHHVQGLTRGVVEFADALRRERHSVTVPDLFGGRTFETLTGGVEHVDSVGIDSIIRAGTHVGGGMPEGTVYAGFSLGALIAHKLAQTQPGAAGALLYHHGDVPLHVFGETWPPGVPVQLHINEGDDFYEPETVATLVDGADAELFLYPGPSHLFTDSSLPGYDAASTALVLQRSLEFLDAM